ncbi:MAG TPA: STAS domain-containing protein [Thermoguttaceae bacterium]
MLAIAPGWELDVERGPDWLFLKIQNKEAYNETSPPLAERIWDMMQQHLTSRLVLDLSQIPLLNSYLIGQLIKLYKQICEHDGVMRLCGLSSYNRRVLHTCHLEDRFQLYHDRREAVMGYSRPGLPR